MCWYPLYSRKWLHIFTWVSWGYSTNIDMTNIHLKWWLIKKLFYALPLQKSILTSWVTALFLYKIMSYTRQMTSCYQHLHMFLIICLSLFSPLYLYFYLLSSLLLLPLECNISLNYNLNNTDICYHNLNRLNPLPSWL